ncbi:MAG TPA: IS200/IS605 family transposase [Acidobacteriota bacterium]
MCWRTTQSIFRNPASHNLEYRGERSAITADIEERLYRYLRHRIAETSGAFLFEVGGVEDHIHLAVRVPPTITLSTWIGQLKGSSSHYINHQTGRRHRLDWQEGYGAVSFGRKDLESVCDYIRRQKEHHARGTLNRRLECTESPDEQPAGVNAGGDKEKGR